MHAAVLSLSGHFSARPCARLSSARPQETFPQPFCASMKRQRFSSIECRLWAGWVGAVHIAPARIACLFYLDQVSTLDLLGRSNPFRAFAHCVSFLLTDWTICPTGNSTKASTSPAFPHISITSMKGTCGSMANRGRGRRRVGRRSGFKGAIRYGQARLSAPATVRQLNVSMTGIPC
jgi:hypothetical protein